MKIKYYLVFMMILLFGCKDNTTEPTDEFSFYGLKDGASYIWKYTSIDFDKDGKFKEDTRTNETIQQIGKKVVLGKNAFVLLKTYQDNKTREDYFYIDNKKLFAHSSYITPNIGGQGFDFPINIPESWALIADDEQNQWDIVSVPITDSPIATPFGEAKINGTLSIKGEKGASSEITFNNKKYQSKEFSILYQFTGKVSISFFNNDLNFTIRERYVYANKIGLYELTREPITITVPQLLTQTFDGRKTTLIETQNILD